MIEHFVYAESPSVARKLVRLSQANSRVTITDDVRILAERAIIPEEEFCRRSIIDPRAKELVQELIDLDLRAAISLPNFTGGLWLQPALTAASLRGGFKTVILGGDSRDGYRERGLIAEILPGVDIYDADEIAKKDKKDSFEALLKQRDTTLYLHSNNTGYMIGLPELAYIFHHTLFAGPSRLVNGVKMYPNFHPLSTALAKSSAELIRRGFSPKIKDVAFLFNVAMGMSGP